MTGWGHDLVSLPILGRSISAPGTVNAALGGNPSFQTIEEHVDRSTRQPRLLVNGARYTDWTGLAVGPHTGRVFVAAGGRSLWAFAPVALRRSAPVVIDLGGECLDVIALREALLVLVQRNGHTELVAMRDDEADAAPAIHHSLSGGWNRFVR